MGFKQKTTLSSGVVVEYWNIQEIRLNKDKGFVDAKLQGFLNKKAYDDGLDQVVVKSVRIAWDDFEEWMTPEKMSEEGANIYTMIYGYAKVEDEFFKGAEDVLDYPEFEQPTSTNYYNKGDTVVFEGKAYTSTIDTNTWSPSEYPQGWKEV